MIAPYRYLTYLAISLGAAASASPALAQSTEVDEQEGGPMAMEGDEGMGMMEDGGGMSMMGGIDISGIPQAPPVAGYSEGERIFFIHTEVSDPEIGVVMTEMMGSPVPVVPSLADAPESMLATVWAFTNGIKPDGPRGPLEFQPDVFDHPVGTDGYRPLRALFLVTWGDGATPRLLPSAAEVEAAIAANEVSVAATSIVVNAPLLTWPGGQR